jgi:hypothetical protein
LRHDHWRRFPHSSRDFQHPLGGIVVAELTVMTPVPDGRNTPIDGAWESIGVVRWVLLRGSDAVTCEVRFNGLRSYDVSVLPHWTRSMAVVEHYQNLLSALHRQADIAGGFQHDGWLLAHEPPPTAAGVAA